MTIEWKDGYVQIPKDGISEDLAKEIIELLPTPEDKLGLKFKGYRVVSLSQVNFKDKAGNSDNPVRVSGTKGKESLEVRLKRGMDVREHTPSLYSDNNLNDGATRRKFLTKWGYKQWIFSDWDDDIITKTKYQSTKEDCIEDFRMHKNADDGKRPATDDDILELVRRRSEGKKWKKEDIKGYLNTLELNLSGSKIDGLANRIDRDRRRRGVIAPYDNNSAHEYVEKNGENGIVLNTKSGANYQCAAVAIMRSVVSGKKPANVITYSSSACSHDDIDKDYEDTTGKLSDLIKLTEEFINTCNYYKIDIPYIIKGSIPQKIIKDKNMPKGYVKYNQPVNAIEKQIESE